MSAESATVAGRAAAMELFKDSFAIYSPTGDVETNDYGFEVPFYRAEGTTLGKVAGSSVQSRDTSARTVSIGGIERPVISGGLHIPVSAPVPAMGDFGVGWEYELTTLGPLTDPSLLNSRWLVVDAPAKSYATARRLDVVRLK